MIDFNRLLTQVLGGGSVADGPDQNRPGPSGGLANLANRLGGAVGGAGRTPWLGGQAGALGTGALAGGLAGILMGSKGVREIAGTALQIGAVAAIGGLAYKAYQNYRQGRPVVPQSITNMLGELGRGRDEPDPAWVPARGAGEGASRLLLRAMVAAAHADGHLDAQEEVRIRERLPASGLDAEEQAYIAQLLAQPPSVDELASAATTPELRAEVYAAARLAIEPDSPAERHWLDNLARALGLPPGLRAHLDTIGRAPAEAAA